MYTFVESLRSAFSSIKANGLRSFLTSLGIIIGVTSTISVISLIQGLSASISKEFEGLGSSGLTISAHTSRENWMKGKFSSLKHSDLYLISEKVSGISNITPMFYVLGQYGGSIEYKGKDTQARIIGSTHKLQDVTQRYTQFGRFISVSDNETRRRVCVIGEDVRKNLGLPDNPIGQFIRIRDEWFKVVGLLEEKGELFGVSQDDMVVIPYDTGKTLIGNQADPNFRIMFNVNNHEELERVRERISIVLRLNHGLGKGEEDDFKIQTGEQLGATFKEITNLLTAVLGGIVGISLLVGGIGIMNIMLVSVTERTREIGICKAVGAKSYHILLQFLTEAITLSLLGGIVGIILGYAFGILISNLIPGFPPASIPIWAIFLSIGFSGSVGVVFGVIPAVKAANLNPIESLRYE